jgi:hypothetical protein
LYADHDANDPLWDDLDEENKKPAARVYAKFRRLDTVVKPSYADDDGDSDSESDSDVAEAAMKRRKAASVAASVVPSRKSRRLETVAKPSYADDNGDSDSDSSVADW